MTLKCTVVVVGDALVGKSALIKRLINNEFTEKYVPTSFDKLHTEQDVDKHRVEYVIWDTSGCPAYDSVRSLAYADADAFLLCYKITDPTTLANAKEKWIQELRRHRPDAPPVILCGCGSDLRSDPATQARLAKTGSSPVSPEQALAVCCEIGAVNYVETSSKDNSSDEVSEAFEVSALAAIKNGRLEQKMRMEEMKPVEPDESVTHRDLDTQSFNPLPVQPSPHSHPGQHVQLRDKKPSVTKQSKRKSILFSSSKTDLSSTISSSTSSKLSEVTQPPQPPPAPLQIAPPSINKMLNVSFSGSDTESMAALSIAADSTSKEVKRGHHHHHHNLPHHHLSSTSLEQQNPPFRTRINSSFSSSSSFKQLQPPQISPTKTTSSGMLAQPQHPVNAPHQIHPHQFSPPHPHPYGAPPPPHVASVHPPNRNMVSPHMVPQPCLAKRTESEDIILLQMPSDSGPPPQHMVNHQPPANVRSNGLCRRTSFRTSGVSLGSQGPKAVASPKSPPPNLVMPPGMALAPPPQMSPGSSTGSQGSPHPPLVIDLERQTVTVTSSPQNSQQGKQQVDPKFKTGGSTTSTGSKMSSCGSMDESSGSLRSGADPPTSLKKKSLVDMVVAEHVETTVLPDPFRPGDIPDTEDPELLSQLKFVSPKSGVFRPVPGATPNGGKIKKQPSCAIQ